MTKAVRHETDNYKLETERNGLWITLTRKSDGHSAFFQDSEDTALWLRNMDALEAIKTWNAGNSLDQSFDFLCEGYGDILED